MKQSVDQEERVELQTPSWVQQWGREFDWINRNHKPSWKRHGSGVAGLTIRQHKKAGWLSVYAWEHNSETDRTREVMFTLSAESAKALRDFLNEHAFTTDRPASEQVASSVTKAS